jgi:hypothetical protein
MIDITSYGRESGMASSAVLRRPSSDGSSVEPMMDASREDNRLLRGQEVLGRVTGGPGCPGDCLRAAIPGRVVS